MLCYGLLTLSTDRGRVSDEPGQARADGGVPLDGAGGVPAARLGRAGVQAVLADAGQVLGAVGVAGALGLGRGIWLGRRQNKMQQCGPCRTERFLCWL